MDSRTPVDSLHATTESGSAGADLAAFGPSPGAPPRAEAAGRHAERPSESLLHRAPRLRRGAWPHGRRAGTAAAVAQAHERCRAELIPRRVSFFDPIGECPTHVVQQQIGVRARPSPIRERWQLSQPIRRKTAPPSDSVSRRDRSGWSERRYATTASISRRLISGRRVGSEPGSPSETARL